MKNRRNMSNENDVFVKCAKNIFHFLSQRGICG